MSAPTKSRCLRVLGVDPAAAGPTGYGVVESDGRSCRSLHYGALKVADKIRKESAGAALETVHSLICGLLRDFAPDALAVESIFSALNVKTALRLAEVRGVVLLAAAQHGVEVHSYAPRLIKASVAGYGHADKRQLQLMVRSLLGLEEIPEPSDAADALAVAVCHLQREQFRARFSVPVELARGVGVARAPQLCLIAGSARVAPPTARPQNSRVQAARQARPSP
jgi:crossover junction endodeoxyribonuclease RuvC